MKTAPPGGAVAPPPSPAIVPEGRFRYVDSLRGIASLAVACYHITRYGPLADSAREVIPGLLQGVFDRGWVGVQVFFVISGFVIAYSVRKARVTPAYIANYALRRSLRLDPPYWTTIAVVLLLHAILSLGLKMTSPLDVPDPLEPELSSWVVLGHLLYIHKILGYDSLSAGFWTLCIEVQFYLIYVVGMGLVQAISRFICANRWTNDLVDPAPPESQLAPAAALPSSPAENDELLGIIQARWQLLLFGGLAVGSLFYFNLDRRFDNWIIYFFCLFFLGVLAWWTLAGQTPAVVFWIYTGLILQRLIATGGFSSFDQSLELKAALLTGVSIYLTGRANRLTCTLDWWWLQSLGRISYSLYLIHFPVSHVVTTCAERFLGSPPAPGVAALVLAVALAASIGAAQVLYVCVEAPSVRLAARFRYRETRSLPAEPAAAESLPQPASHKRSHDNAL